MDRNTIHIWFGIVSGSVRARPGRLAQFDRLVELDSLVWAEVSAEEWDRYIYYVNVLTYF